MSTIRTNRTRSGIRSLIGDRRGAAAFEMAIVFSFLMFMLLMPLADLAIAGFRYISAWQSLRAFGQYLQYNQPPDVTSASTWMSTAIAKSDSSYPVTSIQLICGNSNSACSTGNADSANPEKPKYYVYTTTVTLTPMVLKWALCVSDPCTYTLPYSQRFQ